MSIASTITVESTAEAIYNAYLTQRDSADSTIKSVGETLESEEEDDRIDISVALTTLKIAAENLTYLSEVAKKRAIYENSCCFGGYQRGMAAIAVTVTTLFQLAAGALATNTAFFDSSESSKSSLATATSIIVTFGVTEIKNRVCSRYDKLKERLDKMEEISLNSGRVAHINAMVTIFESYQNLVQRIKKSSSRPPSRAISEAKHTPATSQISVHVPKPVEEVDKVKLREMYVTKLGGIYPRLDGENIALLKERFDRQLDVMQNQVIGVAASMVGGQAVDLRVSIHELDNGIDMLAKNFLEVSAIKEFSVEIDKNLIKRVATVFSRAIEYLSIGGAFASSVIEAVAANKGSGSPHAKVGAFILCLINMGFSWANTGIDTIRGGNTRNCQMVRVLDDFRCYEEHYKKIRVIYAKYQNIGKEVALGLDEDSEIDQGEPLPVLDSMPQVVPAHTPLGTKIQSLHHRRVIASNSEWKQYAGDAVSEAKPNVTPASTVISPGSTDSPAKRSALVVIDDVFS